MKTIRLKTCDNIFEAQLVKNELENAGIPVILANEIMSTYPPMSGVDILVSECDYERAMRILCEV